MTFPIPFFLKRDYTLFLIPYKQKRLISHKIHIMFIVKFDNQAAFHNNLTSINMAESSWYFTNYD